MSESAQLVLSILGPAVVFCVLCTIVAAVSTHYSRPKLPKSRPGIIARTFVFVAKFIVRSKHRRLRAQAKAKLERENAAKEASTDSNEQELAPFPAYPVYPVAIRHRCIRVKGHRKVFIADYTDGVSIAKCVDGTGRRFPLGEASTSPEADRAFAQSALAC